MLGKILNFKRITYQEGKAEAWMINKYNENIDGAGKEEISNLKV